MLHCFSVKGNTCFTNKGEKINKKKNVTKFEGFICCHISMSSPCYFLVIKSRGNVAFTLNIL